MDWGLVAARIPWQIRSTPLMPPQFPPRSALFFQVYQAEGCRGFDKDFLLILRFKFSHQGLIPPSLSPPSRLPCVYDIVKPSRSALRIRKNWFLVRIQQIALIFIFKPEPEREIDFPKRGKGAKASASTSINHNQMIGGEGKSRVGRWCEEIEIRSHTHSHADGPLHGSKI